MNIVHVIDTLDPAAGGPPAVVLRLAAAQCSLGHEVHIVSHRDSGEEERLNATAASIPGLGAVTCHAVERSGAKERLTASRADRILAALLADADFAHLHGIWEPILPRAARIARQSGVRFCIAPHGMLDPWSLSQKRWKKAIALRLGYRRMLNAAAFLHTLNADEARLLAPLALTPPPVIIPNGIFLEEMDLPAKGAFRCRFPALGDAPFILFLSRLHYKKGLDHLADAFARVADQHPDAHLVVAGPDGGARPAFEEAIARQGLPTRVHVVGPLYGPEKQAALADAACFCLPSRQEGFSMAILEALAASLPVVLSEECRFPEVETVGAGHIVPLSATHIAPALLSILADPDEARRMGQRGRGLVRERFLWPTIASRSIEAYSTHQASPRARPTARRAGRVALLDR